MFYKTKGYPRSSMLKMVLEAGQFAHIPLSDVDADLNDTAREFSRISDVYEGYRTNVIGFVKAYFPDLVFQHFHKKYGSLCPCCLTPIADGETRSVCYEYDLMPSWEKFAGDDIPAAGWDFRGSFHFQCAPVAKLMWNLRNIGSENQRSYLECVDQIDLLFKRKGSFKVFAGFVNSRPKPPLRFNPRNERGLAEYRHLCSPISDEDIEGLAA